MKNVLLLFLFLFARASFAQERETFDVATYTIPKGWKKVNNTENVVALAITNNQKGTYCQIGIYKTTISKGNLDADFKNEWAELIVKPYKTTENPTLVPKASENGWDVQGGSARFEFSGGQSVAMLVTMSASDRCMSIVVVTNTTDYQPAIEKFLESVELKKAEAIAPTEPPVSDSMTDGSIIGTWAKGASPNQKYDDYKNPYSANNSGYQKDQYTFNSNGTYNYVSKTFRMTFDKILLIKENGSYQISGNSVTINPQKSVIEAWSKKDGTDKWGDLLTTQNRPLEKVTYTFTKHYFSGIQQWNLVLQAGKETQRDGTFSSNTTFTNAWYFLPISATNTTVDLPGTEVMQKVEVAAKTSGTDYQPVLQDFPESVDLKKVETNTPPAPPLSDNSLAESIVGTWGKGTTIAYRSGTEGTAGTTIIQYTFNANGTYSFYIRTFRYHYDKLLLTKETGTYQISGNNLTVNPKKAVIEAWSKKDGTDNWGQLLSNQNKTLEKTTYQFTKHYSLGMQQWELVLQANKETQRDGTYNGGTAFSNAWIYSPVKCKDCFIKLPD